MPWTHEEGATFMRKRFQKGDLRPIHGSWIGRYYDNGGRVVLTLGLVREMTKSEARAKLAEILRPINAGTQRMSPLQTFGDFVEHVFFPFYRRKWKRSTAITTEDRIQFYVVRQFGKRKLSEITDD